MKTFVCVILLSVCVTVLSDSPLKFHPLLKTINKHANILDMFPKFPIDNKNGNAEMYELLKLFLRQSAKSQKSKLDNLKDFNFKDCGGKIAKIQKLTISPDPISLPGTITLSAKLFLTEKIGNGTDKLSVKVSMKKKIHTNYVKIPCIDGFGSCTYDDICEKLQPVTDCPQFLVDNNIPCNCPFQKGTYNLPEGQIDIGLQFGTGSYNVTGEFMYQNQRAACVQILFTIAS